MLRHLFTVYFFCNFAKVVQKLCHLIFLQYEEQGHQCRGGKAEFSTFQVAVGPRRDTKLFGHFFLCKPTALPQLAHIA